MAFPKQITAAFGNTLRPRDLALTETRAGAAAANASANVLSKRARVCALIFFLPLCVCVFAGAPLCFSATSLHASTLRCSHLPLSPSALTSLWSLIMRPHSQCCLYVFEPVQGRKDAHYNVTSTHFTCELSMPKAKSRVNFTG